MEIFSQNYFPRIRKSRYPIMLGPHAFYWFAIRPQPTAARAVQKRRVPTIEAPARLEALLTEGTRANFEREILPSYVQTCRWFGSKARTLRQTRVIERVAISPEAGAAQIWLVEISYLDGPTETYAFPVQISTGDAARGIAQTVPAAIIARVTGSEETVLHDA